MKALVGDFNQEKALVGAFSVIVQPVVEPMEHYTALIIGEFTSGIVSKLSAISLSILVIAVNIYFVLEYVIGLGITNAFFIIFVVLTGILYLLFCAYLTIDMVMI